MNTILNTYRKPTNDDINRQMLEIVKKFDEENTIPKKIENTSNGGRRRSIARPLPRRRSSKARKARKSRKSRNTRRR